LAWVRINMRQDVATEIGRLPERLGRAALPRSEDNKEGMSASREKRRSDFTGR
jgi:hypothetical protein